MANDPEPISRVFKTVLIDKYNGFMTPTKLRCALASPIQAQRDVKHQDLFHFFARPVLDILAAPIFLLDAALSIVNCLFSLLPPNYGLTQTFI